MPEEDIERSSFYDLMVDEFEAAKEAAEKRTAAGDEDDNKHMQLALRKHEDADVLEGVPEGHDQTTSLDLC